MLPPFHFSDYPTKIYTLSYLLYPLVGAVITVTVGVIVSLLSGGTTIIHGGIIFIM